MIAFSTFRFGQALVDFTRFRFQLSDICDVQELKNSAPTKDFLEIANEALLGIYHEARSAGLEDIADRAQTIADRATIAHLTWNYGELFGEVRQLWQSLEKSLSKIVAFRVSGEKVKYLHAVGMFGESVAALFPDAIDDIRAAGECLAMDLNTASVFESMRTAERGLKWLAKKLRVKLRDNKKDLPITEAEWGKIILGLQGMIRAARLTVKGARRTARLEMYARAADHCDYLREIRNSVSHAQRSYSALEAESVFGRVQEFMQLLTKMK
jgi:hypothetical protein